MHEPEVTAEELAVDGWTLEDYETEIVEVWPDNELALFLFSKVGSRWRIPPMGGVPNGLEWVSIYPLMDRLKLNDDDWNDLHDCLMIMESEAIKTMHEFAPKKDDV